MRDWRLMMRSAMFTALTLGVLAMSAPAAQPAGAMPQLTDATASSGIRFRHTNGAFGKKYLPETLGSGAAFLDVDNDGWQDILLVNSRNWPGRPGAPSYPALYHNNHDGTFTDVTRTAGLAVEMYGLGVAAADYDNDGRTDIYITALGSNHLFRNTGGGRFEDVTGRAGVGDPGFSTSAVWFDYDRDGRLDLFVAHYVDWSSDTDRYCTLNGKTKSYCTPESYKGQSPTLYRNAGDGTFENVTRKAGLYDPSAKTLGLALIDYDNDGLLDVFAANDTQPNRLYRNKGDGTFADVGVMAGVAFNEAGVARAGMGADAADYDGSGRQSLIIGNFSNEMMALYSNEGNGLFIDEAPTSTIGRASLLRLTFACFFFDFDLDGLPGYLRGQRARRRRHRDRPAHDYVRAAATPFPQSRRQEVRGRQYACGGRVCQAGGRARRRLRRLRQRRRSRPDRHRQQRSRAALPQRRCGQPQAAHDADRLAVEP